MGPQRRSLDSHLPAPAPSLSHHPASQGFLTLGPPHSAPTAHSDPLLTSLMTVELRSHFWPLPCSQGQSPQIPHWPHVFPGPSPQPLATIPRTDASLPSMAPEPSQAGPRPLSHCLHPSPMCAGAPAMHWTLFRGQGRATGRTDLPTSSSAAGPKDLLVGLCTRHTVPSALPAVLSRTFLPGKCLFTFLAGLRAFSSCPSPPLEPCSDSLAPLPPSLHWVCTCCPGSSGGRAGEGLYFILCGPSYYHRTRRIVGAQ